MRHWQGFLWLGWLLWAAGVMAAEVYEVGPGRALSRLGEVPWHQLQPGDTVLIHWSPEPYREKWVLCRQGTEEAPITVRGVLNEDGLRPVIEAGGAVTPAPLNYWNEERSLLKIGGANTPDDTMPRWIVVENLDLRGARPGNGFTGDDGTSRQYVSNAAAIHVEKGEHIVIRNCVLSGSGNGLFIGSSATAPTREVLLEGNWIHSNGIEGSSQEHNSYTEALGITFQYNRYGPLREGALGNNLKDRSAGLTVRYNWIESGNRQLDLVEAGAAPVLESPAYGETFVYGNILVEPAGAGNRQIVHYGGDGAQTARYRKGTLWFYHNTVVSTRPDRTTLFRLSTNEERCEAWNNVFFVEAGGPTLSLLAGTGQLTMERNLINPGWVMSFEAFTGAITGVNPQVETNNALFADFAGQEFQPLPESPIVGAAVPLPAAIWERHPVLRWYGKHLGSGARDSTGALGALEAGR